MKTKSDAEHAHVQNIHRTKKAPEDLWFPDYPAHLHIDLLPDIQGRGYGTVLINTVFNTLREKKCPGVHLNVDFANAAALEFYRKKDFIILKENSWGLTLGKMM
ncbi:GNAT family N-acetyltransferase [Brucepastera parasyntrophica]|uniref:GNAT family N-acetyltransferase n=1 Tax=Brucepastera parasyntrophica TaxID=2880008 RepID=UPI00210B8410|nr:GNAT family N-acetyltransferase [Brucepastera parasyntrophica]ULQ59525.1 GNAT family N-acetyltransferase [Brucepastera parasyntrophica]